MPYANLAQQKKYLAQYRKSSSRIIRQSESNRKKAWYEAHRERERVKRRARNFQERYLLKDAVPIVSFDQRKSKTYFLAQKTWDALTPQEALQCFYRDAHGVLRLRTEKQQLDWIKKNDLSRRKPYSIIQGKIWFNRDCVLTLSEFKELASRLPRT
ncbi:MAG: hypothetical protein ACOY3I_01875 [Verrucomicrobiota bacterium]